MMYKVWHINLSDLVTFPSACREKMDTGDLLSASIFFIKSNKPAHEIVSDIFRVISISVNPL